MSIVSAIAGIIDKVLGHWTPQERNARLRREIDALKKKAAAIKAQPPTEKSAKQLLELQKQISEKEKYLQSL